jgi:uncharacterized protein YqgQ
MAGILNKKERVIDMIVTEYGRREMARGNFEVEFVSFSDRGIDYQMLEDDVLDLENSSIISFEAYSRGSDVIIPELDNESSFSLSGQLAPGIKMESGQLVEVDVIGETRIKDFDLGTYPTDFADKNFKSHQILRDDDNIKKFKASPDVNSFSISSESRDALNSIEKTTLPPISRDPRLGNSLVTKLLPPTVTYNGVDVAMMQYDTFGNLITKEEVVEELKSKSHGHSNVSLGEDFKKYDIFGQIFMKRNQAIEKLVIIEVNEFFDSDGKAQSKVFHCGKIFKDSSENGAVSRFHRYCSVVFHNGDI